MAERWPPLPEAARRAASLHPGQPSAGSSGPAARPDAPHTHAEHGRTSQASNSSALLLSLLLRPAPVLFLVLKTALFSLNLTFLPS